MLGSTVDTCSASSRVAFGFFWDFPSDWVDSAPEVDSQSWLACRRQLQWHVPYWFCWY